MLAACLMTQGSRIAPVSIGLGKANQLASSKTLAKPNLRADCVVAFEQAWRRVEDVVGGGERPQVKPSLALESRSLAFQAELTSAHSRVTTRHRLHHYPENQSAAGAASPDVQDGANQSPGSIHRYENAARGSDSPGRRPGAGRELRRGAEVGLCAGVTFSFLSRLSTACGHARYDARRRCLACPPLASELTPGATAHGP